MHIPLYYPKSNINNDNGLPLTEKEARVRILKMSLIKEIMEGADKIADGAPALEYLLIFIDELGEELVELGVEQTEFAPAMRRALESATAKIEERGY